MWLTAAARTCVEPMKQTFRPRLPLLGIVSLCLLAGGCASSYYSVTDPASGKTYYAPKVQTDKKTGMVSFVDVGSGVPMNLQKPQVRKISRQQFNQALYKK
jgi:hypothetical protein